jgi:hypothetical protein
LNQACLVRCSFDIALALVHLLIADLLKLFHMLQEDFLSFHFQSSVTISEAFVTYQTSQHAVVTHAPLKL